MRFYLLFVVFVLSTIACSKRQMELPEDVSVKKISSENVLKSRKKTGHDSKNLPNNMQSDGKRDLPSSSSENVNNPLAFSLQQSSKQIPVFSKEELKTHLREIKDDISSPQAMEAIGQSIKITKWNGSLYLPNQYSSGYELTAAVRRIDGGDTGIISEEVSTDANLSARYGNEAKNNKRVFVSEINDRSPFAESSAEISSRGETTVSKELYSVQDDTTQLAQLHGFIRVEIAKDQNEYIKVIFGEPKIVNTESIYTLEKDVVVDINNKPRKGILTVECQVRKDGGGIKTTEKTYDFENLTDGDKENIKKLGLFNL